MTKIPSSVAAKKRQKKTGKNSVAVCGDASEVAAPESEETESVTAATKEEEEENSKKTKKRKLIVSGSKKACLERGVIYLSNVPNGFYERQMEKFFGQFGAVTNVKLGRSKRTGRSRGYAFIEFRYKEVAEIVAQTMNNYLMFERLMKCVVVPPERVRPAMFAGRIRPQNPPGLVARVAAKKEVNKKRDERQESARRRKQRKSLKRAEAKLRAAGIDFRIELAEVERETRERLRAGGRTPVMEVDDSDLDITMKTPPNVRKVHSRANSAAASPMPSAKVGAMVKKARGTKEESPCLTEAKVTKKVKAAFAGKATSKRKGSIKA